MKFWCKGIESSSDSVRRSSAEGLAAMAKCYNKKALDLILPNIESLLPMAFKQPEDSKIIQEELKDVNVVPSKKEANLLHGFHAPSKIRKEEKGEPWEVSDGVVHLIGELATIYPEAIAGYIPIMTKLMNLEGFKSSIELKEAICMSLPEIMKSLGSEFCSKNIEGFFDGIFVLMKSIKSKSARDCLDELGKVMGSEVLKKKLTAYRPEYATEYEKSFASTN